MVVLGSDAFFWYASFDKVYLHFLCFDFSTGMNWLLDLYDQGINGILVVQVE